MTEYDYQFDAVTGAKTVTEDNLDGTGTRTVYNAAGEVVSTQQLSGLPIPPTPEPTAEERIAELEAIIAALLEAP